MILKRMGLGALLLLLGLGAAARAGDVETWKRKAELAPRDPQVQFNLGLVAFKAQDMTTAGKALKQATDLAPKDAEAWELYGTVLAALKKAGPAADALRTAVKLDGKRGQAWAQLALLLSASERKEDWAEAVKAWEQAARLAPEDGRLRLNQALLLAKLGQTDAAVGLLEKAAGLKGGQAAWRSLCVLYNKAGKTDKAADACTKATEAGGGAEAWYNLGYARQRQGKAPAAREAFQRALAVDPEHAPSLYAVAFLDFEGGDPDKALAGFKAALAARDGEYPEAQYNAAVLLSDLGRYEEAAGLYRDLLKKDPGNADAKAALDAAVEAGTASLLGDGRDAYERGDFEAARKAWQRASALDPGNPEAARLLKQAQAKTHGGDAAVAARKAAKERVAERLKAEDAKVLKQGLAAVDAGRLGDAVRLLDFYLKKNPKDRGARSALFKARAKLREQRDDQLDQAAQALAGGDRGRARKLAQQVLDQDPGNAPATQLLLQAGQAPAKPKRDEEAVKRLYYAGVEQYLAGDLAGAVDTWKKVLGQEPDHLDAKRSLARAELELEALRKRGKS
jgi:tetratricopeptide (TPR) repeat protein